jgi:hypothetical protein
MLLKTAADDEHKSTDPESLAADDYWVKVVKPDADFLPSTRLG